MFFFPPKVASNKDDSQKLHFKNFFFVISYIDLILYSGTFLKTKKITSFPAMLRDNFDTTLELKLLFLIKKTD